MRFLPTSDIMKQVGGGVLLLASDPFQSLPPPSPAHTESSLQVKPRLQQGRVVEGWDGAERTNLPSSLRACLFNSAACRETHVIRYTYAACHKGLRGQDGAGRKHDSGVLQRQSWAGWMALLYPSATQREPGFGGGCPGPTALASYPIFIKECHCG